MNANAKDKNISIKNSVNSGQIVFTDADMLHSVLQNLIFNAIKFTKPEGNINIFTKDAWEYAELSVEDNGIGIKDDDIKNIFGLNCYTTYGTNYEN